MYRFEDVRELGLPLSVDSESDGRIDTEEVDEAGQDHWQRDRRAGWSDADDEKDGVDTEEGDGDEPGAPSFGPRAARKKYDDEDEGEEDVDFDVDDDEEETDGEEEADADEDFDDEEDDDLDDDDDDDDDFDDLDDDE